MKKCTKCFHESAFEHEGVQVCIHCGNTEPLLQSEKKSFTEEEKRLFVLNDVANKYFQFCLQKDQKAKNYIQQRLSTEQMQQFGVGYANSDWTATKQYLINKGFTEKEITSAGITFLAKNGKSYDFFRERIIFPIRDSNGNIVGFSGRTIVGDDRKYINTSENLVFHKKQGFFNLDKTNADLDTVVLVEGQMDVIALHCAGVPNVLATLGTALTISHAHILKHMGVKKVFLCFDGDTAGQNACQKSQKLLKKVDIEFDTSVSFRDCKDPDEFVAKYGKEEARKLFN